MVASLDKYTFPSSNPGESNRAGLNSEAQSRLKSVAPEISEEGSQGTKVTEGLSCMTPCDGSPGVTRSHLCSRNEDQHLCSWGLPAVSEGGKNIWCPGEEGRSQGSTAWLQGTGICGMKERKMSRM